MNRICIFAFLLLVPLLLSAQRRADCKKIKSPGCNSFNEMLKNRNRDLIDTLKTPNTAAYVCFRPGEDAFTVISFPLPTNYWQHTQRCWDAMKARREDEAECAIQEQKYQVLNALIYKNGNYDDAFVINFRWVQRPDKLEAENEDMIPASRYDRKDMKLLIDSTEVLISYKYLNQVKSVTTYTLQIQRDTGTFVETLAPEAGKAFESSTVAGNCIHLEKSAPPHATQETKEVVP